MEVVNHAATCPCIVEELEQFLFPFQTGKSTLYRKKVKEILSHNLSEELIQKLIDSLKNSRAIENFEEYQLADKVTDNLTENQQRIIKLITENNRVSTTQMADNIGISKRKVLDNISKLKKMGLIRRIGTPKAGYWKIINK